MLHLGPIWYHSEHSDVPYSQNLPRPISWFGLFLQQTDSSISLVSFSTFRGPLFSNCFWLFLQQTRSRYKINTTNDIPFLILNLYHVN